MKTEHLTKFNRYDLLILPAILIIAMVMRFYNINNPLADFHSWRQADTAAVARNFVKDGFDLMHPHYDDLSSIQSGKENPTGIRMVEFPIYNAIFAFIYKIAPFNSLEFYGRLTTAFFSLIIIAIIYYLLLKESNRLAAVAGALTYSVMPFFVFFSRVILPETTALSFAMMSIFFLYLFTLETKVRIRAVIFFILSIVCFATGLLVKPTVIFYGLALFYLFVRKYEFNLPKQLHFYLFFVLAAIPTAWWRNYILQFPEGIPPSDWLITHVNTYQGLQPIFFRPAFFRWIFYERIANIIFGGFMTFFFILGLIVKQKKFFLHSIILSGFVYVFVFQGGNVQHEYYQTILLPALAVAVGMGVAFIQQYATSLNLVLAYPIFAAIFIASFLFSYYRVQDYYHIPTELPQIAKIVNTLTLENDRIVTDRLGDTTLLYLMNRKGAPAIYKDLPDLKKLGYKYLVTQNSDTIKDIKGKNKAQVVFENDKFALFKL